METLEKPTIKELLDAVKLYHSNISSEDRGVYREKLQELFHRNMKAINDSWDNGKHDRQAFDTLIGAIELNGIAHFNMSTFMGSIPKDWWQRYDSVNQVTGFYDTKEQVDKIYLDSTTTSFNCDTVGCIAGFATAVAMDWFSESWLKDMPFIDRNEAFVHIACNYLNIPKTIGERIFYGEEGCIWSFVKTFNGTFEDIEFSSEYDEYGDEYSWEDKGVDLNSIGYKHAVEVLRMINTGEIQFDKDYFHEPYFVKDTK